MFNEVFIVTGSKGKGKTTLVKAVIERLRKRGVAVAGILAPELVENNVRAGYNVQNIETGEQMVLCKWQAFEEGGAGKGSAGKGSAGRFNFGAEAIVFGEEALAFRGNGSVKGIIIIDELGPYELRGECWASAMDHLAGKWTGPMLWVVRESLIGAMLQRWPAKSHTIFNASEADSERICLEIINTLIPNGISSG